jgi:uncharacterized protein YjbJ (UPF0337 family)
LELGVRPKVHFFEKRRQENRGADMTKLKDKAIGRTKQIIAEIIGDGKLRDEGKEQETKAKQQPNEFNPFDDLNRLT